MSKKTRYFIIFHTGGWLWFVQPTGEFPSKDEILSIMPCSKGLLAVNNWKEMSEDDFYSFTGLSRRI